MQPARILTTIVILLVIFYFLVKTGKVQKPKKLSRLAQTSFVLILAGIMFGENRTLGYVLIGSGMAFAIADLIKNRKK